MQQVIGITPAVQNAVIFPSLHHNSWLTGPLAPHTWSYHIDNRDIHCSQLADCRVFIRGSVSAEMSSASVLLALCEFRHASTRSALCTEMQIAGHYLQSLKAPLVLLRFANSSATNIQITSHKIGSHMCESVSTQFVAPSPLCRC